MKKYLFSLCIALIGLCASAQQKGDMAVGLNLGVAPCIEEDVSLTNFGIGAKFQYNPTNHIRLEADFDYWLKDKEIDMFDVTANIHYLFNIGSKLNVYPLVGIGYGSVGLGDVTRESRLIVNAGLGGEFAITSKFSVGLEIKYQYMKDFSRLPISVGATYKF